MIAVRNYLRVSAFFLAVGIVGSSWAQNAGTPAADDGSSVWRGAGGATVARNATPPIRRDDSLSNANEPGKNVLPNDAGQVWREYDLTPYTTRVTNTQRPEQAVVDWILQETGYEMWHTDPLSILSVNRRSLRVYHTPEMQKFIADLVDRFVSSEAASYTFSMRVATVDSPAWRTTSQRLLRSVPVRTQGIQAWVMAKEDAATLLGELRRRGDYREHNSPYLVVNNGQSTVVSTMRGRSYVREVASRPNTATGFEQIQGQVDEGFTLEFSPLMSADRRMIDASIKCQIDQIEKMLSVLVDVPTQPAMRQRTKIEVPQTTHFRFHERFRWPTDQVLVVGLGVVALPLPVNGESLVPGLPLPIGNSPPRADLLVFVECKGVPVTAANAPTSRPPLREAKNYRGRY
jgi:hypothetical protein